MVNRCSQNLPMLMIRMISSNLTSARSTIYPNIIIAESCNILFNGFYISFSFIWKFVFVHINISQYIITHSPVNHLYYCVRLQNIHILLAQKALPFSDVQLDNASTFILERTIIINTSNINDNHKYINCIISSADCGCVAFVPT